MLSTRTLSINPNTYSKDPFSSPLGEQIIVEGTLLLSNLGLEEFTFKKLAQKIGSTEASIYRYFSNKHMFLIYLSNLYWKWLERSIRQLSYEKMSHQLRLKAAISIITMPSPQDLNSDFPYNHLAEVIIAEGPKVYLTKLVDHENKEGAFMAFKTLCAELSQLILNINPDYPYAHSLASTIIESAHSQLFFSSHLPRLTDIDSGQTSDLVEFLYEIVTSTITENANN